MSFASIKQVKPPLGSRVNFNHTLGRGLKGAWMMHTRPVVNVLNGQMATISGTVTNVRDVIDIPLATTNFLTIANTDAAYTPRSQAGVSEVVGEGFSCFARVRADTASRSEGIAGIYGSAPLEWCFAKHTTQDRLYAFVYDNSEGEYFGRYAASMPVGSWTTIGFTWNGASGSSNVKIYFDGVQSDSANFNSGAGFVAVEDSTSPLVIGKTSSWSSANFDGSIDWMMIWGRELNLSEIKLLEVTPYEAFISPVEYAISSIGLVPAAGGGRIMSSLAASGGLAGWGGIAGKGGGLAGQ